MLEIDSGSLLCLPFASSHLSPNSLMVVRVSVLKYYCVSLTKPLIVLCFPNAGCFKNILDLETVIQSEVSQKEKNKYRILTHICGM